MHALSASRCRHQLLQRRCCRPHTRAVPAPARHHLHSSSSTRRQQRLLLIPAAAGEAAAAADAADAGDAAGAAGAAAEVCTRTVKLKKPVGAVFAQNKGGPVYVEEVAVGSHADNSGLVQVGDVLSKCSATVLKAGKEGEFEREGYGQRPYDNFETVMFSCERQEFKTVMAALKSNNARWGILDVTLVLRRPADDAEAALCVKKQEAAQP